MIWLFSIQLHILDGQIVDAKAQRKIYNPSLSDLSVEIEPSLLREDLLWQKLLRGKSFYILFKASFLVRVAILALSLGSTSGI